MPITTTQETASDLSKLIQRASENGERIVLHRDGKPIAAIVSIDDLNELRRREDEEDLRAVEEALQEPGKDITWEDLKKELGL